MIGATLGKARFVESGHQEKDRCLASGAGK